MASCNVIRLSEIRSGFRTDSEFYRPEFVNVDRELAKLALMKIGACARVTDGEHGSVKLTATGVKYLTAENIKQGYVDAEQVRYVGNDIDERNARARVREGDVLVSIKGTLGEIGLAEKELLPANMNRDVAIIKIHSYIKGGYLTAFLRSRFGTYQLAREGSGGVQQMITLGRLRNVQVVVLPRDFQDEVSAIQVSGLEKRKESIRLYSEAKQLLESELGIDKLMHQKQVSYSAQASDLANLRRTDAEYYNPAAREIVRRITALQHTTVRESFDIQSGYPWNSTKFLPDNSGEPVVRIRNIKPNHIIPDELTSIDPSYANSAGVLKARRGDVVVGMDGIKYFYASLLDGECFVNQRVCHLLPRSTRTISPEYTVFMINSVVGQAQLMRDMTVATTVGHITNRDVSKLVVPTSSRLFHDKVTVLIRKSIDNKEESKRLLDQAKARVEQFIEEAAQPESVR